MGGVVFGASGGGLGECCETKHFEFSVKHLAGLRGAFGPPLSGYVLDLFDLFQDFLATPLPPPPNR